MGDRLRIHGEVAKTLEFHKFGGGFWVLGSSQGQSLSFCESR